MGVMIASHVHGRGPVGNGDWEPEDIIECYDAVKERNPKTGQKDIHVRMGLKKFTSANPFSGWEWWQDMKEKLQSKLFIFAFLPNNTSEQMIKYCGRGMGRLKWKAKFSGEATKAAKDRRVSLPLQDGNFNMSDIVAGPGFLDKVQFFDKTKKIWIVREPD